MNIRSHRILLAIALAAMPAALSAQQGATQPGGAASGAAQPDPQAILTELQGLHTKLEALQTKALNDPELSTAQQTLGTNIKAAMESLDPTLDDKLTQGQQLQTQATAAQAAGDTVKLKQLTLQMQAIQNQFLSAQSKALQQPELASQVQAFQVKLEKKMADLDPEAPTMIARFSELQAMLANVGRNP